PPTFDADLGPLLLLAARDGGACRASRNGQASAHWPRICPARPSRGKHFRYSRINLRDQVACRARRAPSGTAPARGRFDGSEVTNMRTLILTLAAGAAALSLAACNTTTEQKAATGVIGGAVVGGPV